MVSYAEQMARSAIPMSRALPTELAMDFRVVRSGDGAASVLAAAKGGSGDAAYPEPDRRDILHGDITERALLRVSVRQPAPAALDGMSESARVRFADAQAALQPRDEPGGIVTYPYLGLRAGEYLRFIGDRLARDGDGAALFVLDAGMDAPTMEKILEFLGNRGGPALVPVIHGGAGGSPGGSAAHGSSVACPLHGEQGARWSRRREPRRSAAARKLHVAGRLLRSTRAILRHSSNAARPAGGPPPAAVLR